MRTLFAIALFALSLPAHAQDAAYTAHDEITLQQCIEAVHAGAEEAEPASLTDCIGAAAGLCQEEPGGSSTVGISECNQRETAWWDMLLNAHYAALRESLEPELFATLQSAQRAWIAYRDAECGFLYDYWADGSIRTVVHSSCLLDQTATRAIALDTLLTGY